MNGQDPLAAAASAALAATTPNSNAHGVHPGGGGTSSGLNSSIDSQHQAGSNPTNSGASGQQNTSGKTRANLAHSDDDSGCALEEYTWVPPGLKPDQVRRPTFKRFLNRSQSLVEGTRAFPHSHITLKGQWSHSSFFAPVVE